MNKTNQAVSKSQKINASWQGNSEVNPVYQNYLNWLNAWKEGVEYIEPSEYHNSNYINRPEGFKTKSVIIRVMFDYLLLTYTRNKAIDITDQLDRILEQFFKNVNPKDLIPLDEKSFFSVTKKYTHLQELAKKKKKK